MSFETKRKLSEIKKGKPGHPQTVEAREKISDAKRNQTAETREKIRQSLLGRRRKFETIVKVVEARKGRKLTLQERAELKERVTKRRAKERAGAIDTMLWEYAVKHGLLSCVVQTYRITAEEILLLRSYYQHPGTERRPADDLLDRFSVALANVA
ncbi:MAG: NUMOD3 domain-containing DNA-binding protein [Chloroflexota bacterium]